MNLMRVVVWESKRKVRGIGPKCSNGSIARGISTMWRLRRLPMTILPVVVMPVVESVLLSLSRPIFFFHIAVDMNPHWPLILL